MSTTTKRRPARKTTARRAAAAKPVAVAPQALKAPQAPQAAKTAKTAKAAKTAKVAAKPAGKPAVTKAIEQAAAKAIGKAAAKAPLKPADKAPKKPKPVLVRDGFTMPEADFALIAVLKKRAAAAGREAKKSELLRAGLRALAALAVPALVLALNALEPVKVGRPRKGH